MNKKSTTRADATERITPLSSHLTPGAIARLLEREGALYVAKFIGHSVRRSAHFRTTATADRVLARALHHENKGRESSLSRRQNDRTPPTSVPTRVTGRSERRYCGPRGDGNETIDFSLESHSRVGHESSTSKDGRVQVLRNRDHRGETYRIPMRHTWGAIKTIKTKLERRNHFSWASRQCSAPSSCAQAKADCPMSVAYRAHTSTTPFTNAKQRW